jgi:transposase
MAKTTRQRRLWDAYRFPGFRPEPSVRGFFGDPQARILTLRRRSKKRSADSAYLLKESFGQLWDYNSEAWARKFFENWRAQLKWQRLKPYEAFAKMVERHWDGLVAYCKPENKVSLGFVERLNNKIRVIQRR